MRPVGTGEATLVPIVPGRRFRAGRDRLPVAADRGEPASFTVASTARAVCTPALLLGRPRSRYATK